MSCDPIGSRGRSLKYWAQTPQDEYVCLIAACIPGQYMDLRARRILLSALLVSFVYLPYHFRLQGCGYDNLMRLVKDSLIHCDLVS